MQDPSSKIDAEAEQAIDSAIAPAAATPPKTKIHTRNPYEKRLMNDLQNAARQANYHVAQHRVYEVKMRGILVEMHELGMIEAG